MTVESLRRRPVVLCVLDGWGYREDARDNAIAAARTPVWDRLVRTQPMTLLSTSAKDVGLPEGQMGNSEVGHLNLGAGRIVYQDLTRINKAVVDGELTTNGVLQDTFKRAVGRRLHLDPSRHLQLGRKAHRTCTQRALCR